MTLAAFQTAAGQAIHAGTVTAGDNYIVDHQDGTVYLFGVWANRPSIAFDQLYRRDAPDYRAEYRRACSVERANHTLHFPRAAIATRV